MSDYYGDATLEDWLSEEVFRMEYLPEFIIQRFECIRQPVEQSIEQWMETDDGYGNRLSWRGWGRGFDRITLDDDTFNDLINNAKQDIVDRRRVATAAVSYPTGVVLCLRYGDSFSKNPPEGVNGKNHQEGFVDQWGNFLSKEVAWLVAENQGQIKNPPDRKDIGTLEPHHLDFKV